MIIKEKILFPLFDKLKKSELIEYLKSSFDEMDDTQKRHIFSDLYKEKINKGKTSEKLFLEVKAFYDKSIRGFYYESFYINSKNFMDIPDKTDEWFSELGNYLDESTKLVRRKEFETANKCFEYLYDLIEKMENGEEIIFADEYGTWMITADLDYDEAYIKSSAQTDSDEEFIRKVIPLLIRDSHESFSGKIYHKIKKLSDIDLFEKA